jgi:hypothetical protein
MRQEEDECGLEVLSRLIGSWIPGCSGSPADWAQVDGRVDGVQAQACLSRFELAVHLLLEQYLDEGRARQGCAAYDAGLAAGFYGAGSAIAKGLGERLEGVMRTLDAGQAGKDSEYPARLMREIWVAGQSHGHMVGEWMHQVPSVRRDGTRDKA